MPGLLLLGTMATVLLGAGYEVKKIVHEQENLKNIPGVNTHDDFTSLPDDVYLHSAFAYASYDSPDLPVEKQLFKNLRGYKRDVHKKYYSIFKSETEEERYIVAFRGTDVLDPSDIWQDVSIAFMNNPGSRKSNLEKDLKAWFESISRRSAKVSFTGHSLGGTLCSQLYSTIKESPYGSMLTGGAYSFNPGVAPFAGQKKWKEILADGEQVITMVEGDLVWVSLAQIATKVSKSMSKSIKARLHLITGLNFTSGGVNALPAPVQRHEMPAFFTRSTGTQNKTQALTRAELNRYLQLEDVADTGGSDLKPFQARQLLSDLVYALPVKSGLLEQALESRNRVIRNLSASERKFVVKEVDYRIQKLLKKRILTPAQASAEKSKNIGEVIQIIRTANSAEKSEQSPDPESGGPDRKLISGDAFWGGCSWATERWTRFWRSPTKQRTIDRLCRLEKERRERERLEREGQIQRRLLEAKSWFSQSRAYDR